MQNFHFRLKLVSKFIWPLFLLFQNSLFAAPTHLNSKVIISPRIDTLISWIASAEHSLDIEAYTMYDFQIQNALLAASKKGVHIRILKEPRPVAEACTSRGSQSSRTENCDRFEAFASALVQAGGEFKTFDKSLCGNNKAQQQAVNCFQHGKIMIRDGKQFLLSTGNFDATSWCDTSQKIDRCNREVVLFSNDETTLYALRLFFESDWKGLPYSGEAILQRTGAPLTVSSFNGESLTKFIRLAKSEIKVASQYLKDPEVSQALVDASARGVKVSTLFASFCAYGSVKPSAALDRQTQTFRSIASNSGNVKFFSAATKINGKPGYLHEKFVFVDGVSWIGSINFSTTSIERNREYGVFLNDAILTSALEKQFDEDYVSFGAETLDESLACVKDHGKH